MIVKCEKNIGNYIELLRCYNQWCVGVYIDKFEVI